MLSKYLFKDILKFLIDNGADIDARSRRGNTALMNAVKEDNRGCIAILLMGGANDAILNKKGKTVLVKLEGYDWQKEKATIEKLLTE